MLIFANYNIQSVTRQNDIYDRVSMMSIIIVIIIIIKRQFIRRSNMARTR